MGNAATNKWELQELKKGNAAKIMKIIRMKNFGNTANIMGPAATNNWKCWG